MSDSEQRLILSVRSAIVVNVRDDGISARLVEWNVAMSLHDKTHLLAKLNPTVAVLPESAHPDRTRPALECIGASSMQWVGGNPNKGLLAVAFNGWNLRIDESYDPGYQWVMPLHLTGPGHIRLLAVWDMNHRGKGHTSARQLGACRASIAHYEDFLSGESDLVLISGDFNNSVYWDKPSKRAKFGDFMDQLETRGYVSAYHHHKVCERGAEPDPTLWWMKNTATTYHIDYTFVSRAEAVEAVSVGTHDDWLAHSDHGPMTVDLRVGGALERAPELRVLSSTAAPIQSPTARHPSIATSDGPVRKGDTIAGDSRHALFHRAGVVVRHDVRRQWRKLRTALLPYVFHRGLARRFPRSSEDLGTARTRRRDDGTTGQRHLDHRWKQTPTRGPVRYVDLPPQIASQLRAYNAEHGYQGLP